MAEPFDPYAENPEFAALAAAQVKEWGEYVATGDILVGGVLAARKGDAIPISNVEKHRYDEQGLVVKRNSKAGREITGEPEPEPAKPVKAIGGNG